MAGWLVWVISVDVTGQKSRVSGVAGWWFVRLRGLGASTRPRAGVFGAGSVFDVRPAGGR